MSYRAWRRLRREGAAPFTHKIRAMRGLEGFAAAQALARRHRLTALVAIAAHGTFQQPPTARIVNGRDARAVAPQPPKPSLMALMQVPIKI
jgi:outer membrane translocation and assembly module TamA